MKLEVTDNKITISMEGGESNMAKKTKVEKVDEPVVEEAPAVEETVETPEAEVPAEETPVVEAPAEEVAEDAAPVEEKAEGEEEAEVEEKVEETKEEATEEDAPAEDEESEDDSEEEEEEEESEKADSPVVVKLDFSDFKEEFKKLIDPLVEQVKALTEKGDATTEAPAEGSAEVEKTQEVETEKAEKAEDVSKEEKSGDSPEVAPNAETEALLAKINELKNELTKNAERIQALEEQPAPSRVVVVKREGESEPTELEKIETRLAEIEKVRDADPEGYMRNTKLVDEALTLISKKRAMAGNR